MAQSKKQLFWRKHLRAWQASGLTQVAYCQSKSISLASFSYWRHREKAVTPPVTALIPVVRETASIGVQLRSPSGWQIALPPTLDIEGLRTVLAALK